MADTLNRTLVSTSWSSVVAKREEPMDTKIRDYIENSDGKIRDYNDENRVKHSVVEVSDIDHQLHCASLIREIEKLGGSLPESINRDAYVK